MLRKSKVLFIAVVYICTQRRRHYENYFRKCKAMDAMSLPLNQDFLFFIQYIIVVKQRSLWLSGQCYVLLASLI